MTKAYKHSKTLVAVGTMLQCPGRVPTNALSLKEGQGEHW